MHKSLYNLSGASGLLGYVIFLGSESILHQIFAALAFLVSAVLFGSGAIVQAIWNSAERSDMAYRAWDEEKSRKRQERRHANSRQTQPLDLD